jgi:signal transduction histidine kinase
MDDPAIGVRLALRDLVPRDLLRDFLRTYRELFGVGVRLDGPDGTPLADACPEEELCRFVNETPGGRAACVATIRTTREKPSRPGTVGAVPCFTGSWYRFLEVEYDGERLGRVVLGPYVSADKTPALPSTLFEVDPRIDARDATPLFQRMPRLREATAQRLAEHVVRVLEGLLFTGHKSLLTSQMHLAASRESHRELVEKNRALAAAYERLEEVDRLKSNFLATVSHELRTPLTSILGYTEMLREGLAGPMTIEQKEFVSTIHAKGEQLLGLVTGILDLAKIDSSQASIERSWTDVRALAQDVATTFEPHARRGEVSIVVDVPGSVPRTWTDLERLRQVLFNLVDNAVKFTPAGGTVTISARLQSGIEEEDPVGFVVTAPAREDVVLSVADTGIGIAPDCLERIFDAFYQVDNTSTRRFGGTGLGLSIVKRLVEMLDGRIEVRSLPGEGTTFDVTLPVGEPDRGEGA